MKKVLSLGLLLLLLSFTAAEAEFALPGSLTEIDDEAFRDVTALSSLVLPETVTRIGTCAFAGCSGLNEITIPGSVQTIGTQAFSGCGDALLIHTVPNSAAAVYARANQLDYQAGTDYRALVIGQTYPNTSSFLEGPANDLLAVQSCLSSMQTTPWQVTTVSNLSSNSFFSRIASAFSSADANDVSLFYYSGHGRTDGSLVGSNLASITPQMLKAALDPIPGRKVILIDACFSGKLIGADAASASRARSAGTDETLQETQNEDPDPKAAASQFIASFQSAFRTRTRGALNSDGYYVITAARSNQYSQEGEITTGGGSKVMGYFTFGFCLGCGYNGVIDQTGGLQADTNGDQAVSLQEAYAFAAETAASYNPNQAAAVWPSGCTWFAPFRP